MDFTFPGYSKGKNKEILTNSLFFDQISFPGWLIVHQKVNERRSMQKIIETINQFTSKRPSTLLKSTTGNDWVDPNRTYVRQFSCLSLTYEKNRSKKDRSKKDQSFFPTIEITSLPNCHHFRKWCQKAFRVTL